jgi:hypothetical protein
MTPLATAIEAAGAWLASVYRLDLTELGAAPSSFLVDDDHAREYLPEPGPRSALLCIERGETLWMGVYLHPDDRSDPLAILEETSHLLSAAWHAHRNLPVSPLALELQAEVDCRLYAHASGLRTASTSAEWLAAGSAAERERYAHAARGADRYCARLRQRYPRPSDLPGLLAELRAFFRASPQDKLRAAN